VAGGEGVELLDAEALNSRNKGRLGTFSGELAVRGPADVGPAGQVATKGLTSPGRSRPQCRTVTASLEDWPGFGRECAMKRSLLLGLTLVAAAGLGWYGQGEAG
jgi:hypothetical protein